MSFTPIAHEKEDVSEMMPKEEVIKLSRADCDPKIPVKEASGEVASYESEGHVATAVSVS